MISIATANIDKVNTKEELLQLLKDYKIILNSQVIDYLESLINLDFSVIKENIDDKSKKALSELEIYKRIAIYNIYNRAINLFTQSNMPLIITGNEEGFESLSISVPIEDRNIKIFDFKYGEQKSLNYKIPDEYKTMKIGSINLYQKIENKELRIQELKRIINKIEMLYGTQNPYQYHPKKVGGSYVKWKIERQKEIEKYQKMLDKIDSHNELTEFDIKEIKIMNKAHDLLLEDYGLTNDSFEDDVSITSKRSNNLQKTLIKRQSNITITNNIEYI